MACSLRPAIIVLSLAGLVAWRLRWARARARERLEEMHALDRERGRIARDMHDRLGTQLTRITLLADLIGAGNESHSSDPPAARIASSAREAAISLDEITWLVNPRNDSLPGLLNYLSRYAAAFLEPAGVRCRLELPAHPGRIPLPLAYRHDLLLILQEALKNAVSRVDVRNVWLEVRLADSALAMTIADDGRGADDSLSQLETWAAACRGTVRIERSPGGGTTRVFWFPLPGSRGARAARRA